MIEPTGSINPHSSTGSINLQRSYEICKAVVEKSVNRAQVQNQLLPPPSSPLPLHLPPGMILIPNDKQPRFSGQTFAIRGLSGNGLTGMRIRVPVSGSPLYQQTLISRPVLPSAGSISLPWTDTGNGNATPSQVSLSNSGLMLSSSPLTLISSSPGVSYLETSNTSTTVSGLVLSSTNSTHRVQPIFNNSPFFSNLSNLSSSSSSSSSHLSSTQHSSAVGEQLVLRYQVLPSQLLGSSPVYLQSFSQPVSPMQSLQVSVQNTSNRLQVRNLPSPSSPRPFNTNLLVHQINKPLVHQQLSGLKPTVMYRRLRPTMQNVQTSQFLQPQQIILKHSPEQSVQLLSSNSGVKTVMKTTLIPRSTFSESQINSILKQMVPEPPNPGSINVEEKERAQAMAAVAVSNYEAHGPEVQLQSAISPILQSQDQTETLTLHAGEGSSMESITIPEIPERFLVPKLSEQNLTETLKVGLPVLNIYYCACLNTTLFCTLQLHHPNFNKIKD